MATSQELRAWVSTLRQWPETVENAQVREQMIRLAADVERLRECREMSERQLV
jgi:hypothetical protein